MAFSYFMTPSGSTDAKAAAEALAARMGGLEHSVAVVLGSGWLPAAHELGPTLQEIPTNSLPGFQTPQAAGHGNGIHSVRIGSRNVLIFLGRTHYYESRDVAAVAHPVRTAAAAGVSTVILTNGCGGIRESFEPGTPVLISDHLNLTAASPLVGADFVDLIDLYSPRLRALAREIDPTLEEGVYAQITGPHYETPAEIRMLRMLGADLVGMSTSLEAIAARAAGLEVCGISLVTNKAAGITGDSLNHAEVLESGREASARLGRLLRELIERM